MAATANDGSGKKATCNVKVVYAPVGTGFGAQGWEEGTGGNLNTE